jgi:hypothetical protein
MPTQLILNIILLLVIGRKGTTTANYVVEERRSANLGSILSHYDVCLQITSNDYGFTRVQDLNSDTPHTQKPARLIKIIKSAGFKALNSTLPLHPARSTTYCYGTFIYFFQFIVNFSSGTENKSEFITSLLKPNFLIVLIISGLNSSESFG